MGFQYAGFYLPQVKDLTAPQGSEELVHCQFTVLYRLLGRLAVANNINRLSLQHGFHFFRVGHQSHDEPVKKKGHYKNGERAEDAYLAVNHRVSGSRT